MSKKLKTTKEEINKDTGEIITIEKTFSIKTTPENFYMTFISSISGFYESTCVLDTKLLVAMCSMAEYNTGVIYLTSERRKELLTMFSTSNQNISNALKRLKDKHLIEGNRDTYTINPDIFWKGSLDERRKVLNEGRTKVTFSLEPNTSFDNE